VAFGGGGRSYLIHKNRSIFEQFIKMKIPSLVLILLLLTGCNNQVVDDTGRCHNSITGEFETCR